MMKIVARIAMALAAPVLLTGCIVTPGKFVSNLDINADRSFAFSYSGEIYAVDLGNKFAEGFAEGLKNDEPGEDGEQGQDFDDESDTGYKEILFQQRKNPDAEAGKAENRAEQDRKYRAMAEALAKEAGFKSARYVGEDKFIIDYAVAGTLNHGFVFPFNVDAEIVLPFIAVELRGNGTARMRAPAFANEDNSNNAMAKGLSSASKLDGVFTFTTDAEIVSQNNEDGATTVNGRQTIVWKATPISKTPPMAVVRFKP